MHNRRPLRIASTIGPIETGLLPAPEATFSRRTAIPVEHDALGTGAALERAKRGGIDLVIAHAPARRGAVHRRRLGVRTTPLRRQRFSGCRTTRRPRAAW